MTVNRSNFTQQYHTHAYIHTRMKQTLIRYKYHSLSLTKHKIKDEEDNSHDDTTGGEDAECHRRWNVHCHCLVFWYSIVRDSIYRQTGKWAVFNGLVSGHSNRPGNETEWIKDSQWGNWKTKGTHSSAFLMHLLQRREGWDFEATDFIVTLVTEREKEKENDCYCLYH